MIVRVGLVQLLVSGDLLGDLDSVGRAVRELALAGCDVVALGEMFCCPYERGAFARFAEERGGLIYGFLRDLAAECGVLLVGGSFPLKENGRIFNACFVFDECGRELACHRKIHLFDVCFESGLKFCESAELCAGDSVTVFDTKFGRFGVCICYDWRFFELAGLMREAGADCVFVPAAFNTTTGPAHWQTLFRGRSIDNQFFSVGISPARNLNAKYHAYGHSIAVSPFGEILLELDETPKTAIANLDLTTLTKTRTQMPLMQHKRKDLYTLKPKE